MSVVGIVVCCSFLPSDAANRSNSTRPIGDGTRRRRGGLGFYCDEAARRASWRRSAGAADGEEARRACRQHHLCRGDPSGLWVDTREHLEGAACNLKSLRG